MSLSAYHLGAKSEQGEFDAGWGRVATAGYVLIGLTFGVVGGWAAVAKIDRAVSASGVIAIETNRKTVQHLEGGAVREILVKEGQSVPQGAILFRLDDVQAKANSQLIQNSTRFAPCSRSPACGGARSKGRNRVAPGACGERRRGRR